MTEQTIKRNNERIGKAARTILESFKPETRKQMFQDLNVPMIDRYKQLYEFIYDSIHNTLTDESHD